MLKSVKICKDVNLVNTTLEDILNGDFKMSKNTVIEISQVDNNSYDCDICKNRSHDNNPIYTYQGIDGCDICQKCLIEIYVDDKVYSLKEICQKICTNDKHWIRIGLSGPWYNQDNGYKTGYKTENDTESKYDIYLLKDYFPFIHEDDDGYVCESFPGKRTISASLNESLMLIQELKKEKYHVYARIVRD